MLSAFGQSARSAASAMSRPSGEGCFSQRLRIVFHVLARAAVFQRGDDRRRHDGVPAQRPRAPEDDADTHDRGDGEQKINGIFHKFQWG